jgi:hypothetical protein
MTLKIGTKVTIQGEVTDTDIGSEYEYRIRFPSGDRGWFKTSDLTPLSDSSNPYQYGQVLVDKDGDKLKVLGVMDDIIFLSELNELERSDNYAYHWKEVEKMGFTSKGEEPKDTPDTLTVSIDEVATLMSEKTGKKVDPKDIRIKKEE